MNYLYKKINVILLSSLLLIVTLMIQNPLDPYFEGLFGKVQLFDFVFPIVILFFVKNILKNFINKFNLTIVILSVCFIIFSILTSTFVYKHLIYFYLFLILIMISSIRLSNTEIRHILEFFFWFILIMLFICLLAFIYSQVTGEDTYLTQVRRGFPYFDHVVRIIGPFKPTAKHLPFYLMCSWPLIVIWYYYINKNFNYLVLISILCIVVSLLTLGRVGFFTAFLYFSTILYFHRIDEKFYKCILLYTSFVVFFLIVFVNSTLHFELNFLECLTKEVTQGNSSYYGWVYKNENTCHLIKFFVYDNHYLILKKIAINAWLENPIFGKGVGAYIDYYIQTGEKGYLSLNLKDRHFIYPQSQYFLLLAENGIIGFSIWFTIMILCFRKIANRIVIFKSNIGVIFLLSFFSTLIDLDVQNFRYLYLMIGTLLLMSFSKTWLEKKSI